MGGAALVVLVLFVAWLVTLPSSPAWGWDESMHAELPAARVVLALRTGDLAAASAAILDCQQYPFVWPVCLALVQLVTGLSEHAARVTGLAALALLVWGVFLLARELAASPDSREGAQDGVAKADGSSVAPEPRRAAIRSRYAPWLALAFAAACPLAVSFGGTLFLEVPFACAATFTLLAWLRLRRAPTPRRAWIAGAWIAVAFFTKFNYALLLGLGLALDALVDLALAFRRGEGARAARDLARVATPLALGALWWFVLPLPGGLDVAAAHRAAFAEFLHGNLGGQALPGSVRLLQVAAWGAPTPRALLAGLVGAAIALRFVADARVRALAIVFLSLALPVCFHPFHLERFWIPSGPPLWALAGLGLASVLPGARGVRWSGLALFSAGLVVFPSRDAPWLAERLGLGSTDPRVVEYRRALFAERRALFDGRALPTAGLERAEHDALLDLVAREVKAGERVGWLGASSETSPAVVHLGLFARSPRERGDVERFLRDAARPMDVTILGVDPRLDDDALRAWAGSFDVVFATEPPDLKDRSDRRFARSYRERLVAAGWRATELGHVPVARPLNSPLDVTLFACRRSP